MGSSSLPCRHDGIIEVLGARNGCTMAQLAVCNAGLEALCRGKAFVIDVRTPQYMQIDGEGWRVDVPSLVIVSKARTALMLRAPKEGGFWDVNPKQTPAFWPLVHSPPPRFVGWNGRVREEEILHGTRTGAREEESAHG